MQRKHKPTAMMALSIGSITLSLSTLAEIGIAQSILLSVVAVILYWAIAWVNNQ